MIQAEYKRQIAQHLGPGEIHFFWKGRVALHCLLQALGVGKGDEVILPGYTCVVVPNAIIYLNALPVYADVNEETFNTSAAKVESLITRKTKAIITQNTYGLSSDVLAIGEVAKKHGIRVIEDCTHGFGGTFEGMPNGTLSDAAFFSTQWNKPYSSGIGGFAYTSDPGITAALERINSILVQPGLLDRINLKSQYLMRNNLLTDATYWRALRLYRLLSSKGIVIGSSTGEEINSTHLPPQYMKAMSGTQMTEGMRNLKRLPEMIRMRKAAGQRYTELLSGLGKKHVDQQQFADHGFLSYPILVHDRNSFNSKAEASRIRLGDWFTSPLHPVAGNLTPWSLDRHSVPVADRLATHVVTLPTTPTSIENVVDFISSNAMDIM